MLLSLDLLSVREDCINFLFFFQAEDGIRDKLVTGFQRCALPISRGRVRRSRRPQPRRSRAGAGASTRGSDRKSVVEGKSVDLRGRRINKKKEQSLRSLGGPRERTRYPPRLWCLTHAQC